MHIVSAYVELTVYNLLICGERVEAMWRYREYVQLAQNDLFICTVGAM